MHNCRNNTVSAGGLIALALGLLILPLRWLVAAVIAAGFHECCHWVAIRLCGGEISDFRLDTVGAAMEIRGMSKGREMICALAGPAGSLLLLLLRKWFPAVAVCGLLQSAYNLLPIYPLDGGRALRCGVGILFHPKMADSIVKWTERICIATISAAAVYGSFVLKLGMMPVLLALALIAKKNTLQRAANTSTIDLPF